MLISAQKKQDLNFVPLFLLGLGSQTLYSKRKIVYKINLGPYTKVYPRIIFLWLERDQSICAELNLFFSYFTN